MAKDDHRGRTGRHSVRPTRDGTLDEQFIQHRRSWLESDAVRGLSLAARRCLDRLEIEHLAHAGRENGQLTVTYDDFARFGVRRQSIAQAISDLQNAGLVRITERGRGGNMEFRSASKYRLTHLSTLIGLKRIAATDEWKEFRLPSRDIESECENAPGNQVQNRTRKPQSAGAKTHPKPGAKTHPEI